MSLILAGPTIMGLNPAILGFVLLIGLFGLLNIIEFKRFD